MKELRRGWEDDAEVGLALSPSSLPSAPHFLSPFCRRRYRTHAPYKTSKATQPVPTRTAASATAWNHGRGTLISVAPEGEGVGTCMGSADGALLGRGVGAGTGVEVGSSDGSEIRSEEGAETGAGLGTSEGAGAGSEVGSGTGAGIGTSVGVGVGNAVGAGTGPGVGAGTGETEGTVAGKPLGSEMGTGVGGAPIISNSLEKTYFNSGSDKHSSRIR